METNLLHNAASGVGRECQAGFTLTELIVVIFLITTLLSIATLGFNSWQVKYNVEAQVRQMASDINEIRITAMTRKQKHSVTINANSYVFRSYSSDDEPMSAGTIISGGTHMVSYALKEDATSMFSNKIFEIDHRGLNVSSVDTIFVDRGDSANLNCLTLHTVRINVGKRNAAWSSCDDN